LDVRTGKVLWKQQTRPPYDSAALTTAGGLVFVGDWNRHFYAYDAATGAQLWETRTPSSAQGSPITYAVDGRQYLAVPSGTGGNSWNTRNVANLLPDLHRPGSGVGNAILVFALPKASGRP
jgi:alcohol dehydrogenase (cytochrome c)